MANPNIFNTTSIVGGNAGWNLSTSVTTTLMTVDADKIVKINSILVGYGNDGNYQYLTIDINGLGSGAAGVTTTGAATQVYLCKNFIMYNFPAGDTSTRLSRSYSGWIEIITNPIYLMEGDQLRGGYVGGGTSPHLFVSYEVIDDA